MQGRQHFVRDTVVLACGALLVFAAVVLPGDGLSATRFAAGAVAYLLTAAGFVLFARRTASLQR
ncbi:hypothetical protein ACWDZ4_20510 [Streptomyces sp. NPDC003016]